MAGSFTATDPWILARDRYMEDLDEDEKKIFATASLENLFYAASAAQTEHETESRSRAISSKLAPFVAAIDQYGSALDVVSNTYSLVMAPLWGSIRVLLHVSQGLSVSHTCVTGHLKKRYQWHAWMTCPTHLAFLFNQYMPTSTASRLREPSTNTSRSSLKC